MADQPSDQPGTTPLLAFDPLMNVGAEQAPARQTPLQWIGDTAIELGRATVGTIGDIAAGSGSKEMTDWASDLAYRMGRQQSERAQYVRRHPEESKGGIVDEIAQTAIGLVPMIPLAVGAEAAGAAAAPFTAGTSLVAAPAATFAGLSYGAMRREVREAIRDTPEKDLWKSDRYRELRGVDGSNMTDKQARDILWDESDQLIPGLIAAGAGAVGGGVGHAVVSKLIGRASSGQVARGISEQLTEKLGAEYGPAMIRPGDVKIPGLARRVGTTAAEAYGAGVAQVGGQDVAGQMEQVYAGVKPEVDVGGAAKTAFRQAAPFALFGGISGVGRGEPGRVRREAERQLERERRAAPPIGTEQETVLGDQLDKTQPSPTPAPGEEKAGAPTTPPGAPRPPSAEGRWYPQGQGLPTYWEPDRSVMAGGEPPLEPRPGGPEAPHMPERPPTPLPGYEDYVERQTPERPPGPRPGIEEEYGEQRRPAEELPKEPFMPARMPLEGGPEARHMPTPAPETLPGYEAYEDRMAARQRWRRQVRPGIEEEYRAERQQQELTGEGRRQMAEMESGIAARRQAEGYAKLAREQPAQTIELRRYTEARDERERLGNEIERRQQGLDEHAAAESGLDPRKDRDELDDYIQDHPHLQQEARALEKMIDRWDQMGERVQALRDEAVYQRRRAAAEKRGEAAPERGVTVGGKGRKVREDFKRKREPLEHEEAPHMPSRPREEGPGYGEYTEYQEPHPRQRLKGKGVTLEEAKRRAEGGEGRLLQYGTRPKERDNALWSQTFRETFEKFAKSHPGFFKLHAEIEAEPIRELNKVLNPDMPEKTRQHWNDEFNRLHEEAYERALASKYQLGEARVVSLRGKGLAAERIQKVREEAHRLAALREQRIMEAAEEVSGEAPKLEEREAPIRGTRGAPLGPKLTKKAQKIIGTAKAKAAAEAAKREEVAQKVHEAILGYEEREARREQGIGVMRGIAATVKEREEEAKELHAEQTGATRKAEKNRREYVELEEIARKAVEHPDHQLDADRLNDELLRMGGTPSYAKMKNLLTTLVHSAEQRLIYARDEIKKWVDTLTAAGMKPGIRYGLTNRSTKALYRNVLVHYNDFIGRAKRLTDQVDKATTEAQRKAGMKKLDELIYDYYNKERQILSGDVLGFNDLEKKEKEALRDMFTAAKENAEGKKAGEEGHLTTDEMHMVEQAEAALDRSLELAEEETFKPMQEVPATATEAARQIQEMQTTGYYAKGRVPWAMGQRDVFGTQVTSPLTYARVLLDELLSRPRTGLSEEQYRNKPRAEKIAMIRDRLAEITKNRRVNAERENLREQYKEGEKQVEAAKDEQAKLRAQSLLEAADPKERQAREMEMIEANNYGGLAFDRAREKGASVEEATAVGEKERRAFYELSGPDRQLLADYEGNHVNSLYDKLSVRQKVEWQRQYVADLEARAKALGENKVQDFVQQFMHDRGAALMERMRQLQAAVENVRPDLELTTRVRPDASLAEREAAKQKLYDIHREIRAALGEAPEPFNVRTIQPRRRGIHDVVTEREGERVSMTKQEAEKILQAIHSDFARATAEIERIDDTMRLHWETLGAGKLPEYGIRGLLDPGSDLSKRAVLPKGARISKVRDHFGPTSTTYGLQAGIRGARTELIRHFMRVANKLVGHMDVVHLTDEQMGIAAPERGLPPTVRAFYDPKTDRIFITHDAFASLDRGRLMVHEVAHALTETAMQRYPAIIQRMEEIRRQLKTAFKNEKHPAYEAVRDALEGHDHGLDNVHEFVSEFWANDRYSDALAAVEATEAQRKRWQTLERGQAVFKGVERMAQRAKEREQQIKEQEATRAVERKATSVPQAVSRPANLLQRMVDTVKEALRKVFGEGSQKRLLNDATIHALDMLQRLDEKGRARPIIGEESKGRAAMGDKITQWEQAFPTRWEADEPVDVAVNPSITDVRNIALKSEEGVVRILRDTRAGEVYAWDANHLLHDDVMDQFAIDPRDATDAVQLFFKKGKFIGAFQEGGEAHHLATERLLREYLNNVPARQEAGRARPAPPTRYERGRGEEPEEWERPDVPHTARSALGRAGDWVTDTLGSLANEMTKLGTFRNLAHHVDRFDIDMGEKLHKVIDWLGRTNREQQKIAAEVDAPLLRRMASEMNLGDPKLVNRKVAQYVSMENYAKAVGNHEIGKGDNAWIDPANPEHAQHIARHKAVKEMWDRPVEQGGFTNSQKQMILDLRKALKDRHEELGRKAFEDVLGATNLLHAQTPEAVDAAYTAVKGKKLTPEQETALKAQVTDEDAFKAKIKEWKRTLPWLRELQGVFYPMMRQGDYMVHGTYDVERIAKDHGLAYDGSRSPEPVDNGRGLRFRFASEADRDAFISFFSDPAKSDYDFHFTAAGKEAADKTPYADINNMHFSGHQTVSSANRMLAELRSDKYFKSGGPTIRRADLGYGSNMRQLGGLNRLMRGMKNSEYYRDMDEQQQKKIEREMYELTVRHMLGESARSKYTERRYTEGADTNLLDSTYKYLHNTSYTLAELRTRPQMRAAIKDVEDYVDQSHRKELPPNMDVALSDRYNLNRSKALRQMHERLAMRPEAHNSQWLDKATNEVIRATYLAKLGGISFHILNSTEPIMLGLPMLAGEVGNIRAANSFRRAYALFGFDRVRDMAADVRAVLTSGLDGAEGLSDHLKSIRDRVMNEADGEFLAKGIEFLHDTGYLDRDAGFDVARHFDPRQRTWGKALDRVDDFNRAIGSAVEAENRTITATAALWAFRDAHPDWSDAKVYRAAQQLVEKSAGNYAWYNKPGWMNSKHPLVRMATQFRNYPLRVTQNYALMTLGAYRYLFNKDAANPEAHEANRILLRQLVRQSLSQLVWTGARGTALWGMAGAIMSATSPLTGVNSDRAEDHIRAGLADLIGPEWAEFFMSGGLRALGSEFGGGIGERLSHSNLWFQGALGEKPDDWAKALGHLVGGAASDTIYQTASGASNIATGARRIADGQETAGWAQVTKGVQEATPIKAAADVIKTTSGLVFGDETPAGVPKAPEASTAQIVSNMLGLRTGAQAERSEKVGAFMRTKHEYEAQVLELKRGYAMGSANERSAIRQNLKYFNERLPAGSPPVTVSDLAKYAHDYEKKQRTPGEQLGVTLTKKTRPLWEQLSTAYTQ